jgi:hypothetical protein
MGNRGVADYKVDDAVELVPANDELNVDAFTVTTVVRRIPAEPPGPIDLIRLLIIRNFEPTDGTGETVYVKTEEDNEESGGSWDIGCSSPDLSEGYPIEPGASEELNAQGVHWLIAAGASAAVRFMEVA